MSESHNRLVFSWLLAVSGLIVVMVVLGGYVRLTRSGLSIVEWKPISGVIPPIGDAAWEAEFAKYQRTPEYRLINRGMSLSEYQRIFYIEYFHRLIGRLAGLVVAIPLLWFLWRGIIPWRKSPLYVAIGLLFGFQGYLGWYMVSSGLVDRPSVSHFRLTFHLLTALLLLGLSVWAALNHHYRFPRLRRAALRSGRFGLSLVVTAVLLIQIAYGGLMAGLKAGYLSNTYPLMFGQWVPAGLLAQLEPWWRNLFDSGTTVHFIHRWFALVVLLAAVWLYRASRRPGDAGLRSGVVALIGLTLVQIGLGVSVIWFRVPISLALAHQAIALLLFTVTMFINYQIVYEPTAIGTATAAESQTQPALSSAGSHSYTA